MAANQYSGVTTSLERWIWYADKELRGLRHEMEQGNARRDMDIRHTQEQVAATNKLCWEMQGFRKRSTMLPKDSMIMAEALKNFIIPLLVIVEQ